MRRFAATLLVSLMGFSLIGPAIFADAEASLPACCRRGGAHHCAMMDMDADGASPSSGPAVRAMAARCPFYPRGGALMPHSGPALLAASAPVYGSRLGHLGAGAQAEAGYRISAGRSHLKRGPPSLS